MDYQVILSPTAIASLEEITGHIAQDDSVIAECTGNALLDRIAILQKFPRAGSVYSANKAWRKLVSRPYVIVYRIKPKIRVVEVLAFRHSAREPYTGH